MPVGKPNGLLAPAPNIRTVLLVSIFIPGVIPGVASS